MALATNNSEVERKIQEETIYLNQFQQFKTKQQTGFSPTTTLSPSRGSSSASDSDVQPTTVTELGRLIQADKAALNTILAGWEHLAKNAGGIGAFFTEFESRFGFMLVVR